MQTVIQNGTRAVSIFENDDSKCFDCRLYVNCRVDVTGPGALGDATFMTARFRTLDYARTWAKRQLEKMEKP